MTAPAWVTSFIAATLIATASPASAQQVKTIQLLVINGTVEIDKSTEGALKELTASTQLNITCAAKVDCAAVKVMSAGGAVEIQPANTSSSSARVYVLKDAVNPIVITVQGREVGRADLGTSATPQAAPGPLICRPPSDIPATYDRRANRATFWVSHIGNIWAYPEDQIDENDDVEVVVIAPEDLLPKIRVRRTSTTRVVGGITIIGDQLFRQAAEVRSQRCGTLKVVLSDFAPGEGTVQIALIEQDKEIPTGTVSFSVAPLYDGYLSYAAVYTDATARTFKLAPSPDGNIIVPGEATQHGDREIRFAVFYTPFVWGKREIVKGPDAWYHRINPTFGITISELAEHFLYGASFDFGGFTVAGGLHSARQTILSPDSGLQIGDVFAGAATAIPTATDWTHKGFVAAGVDLRAAVTLFKSALGVGKFGQ